MDINLSTEDVDNFNINFTRINHSGGLITYAGRSVIEMCFIDKDNSNEEAGTTAFQSGELGGIFLLKDWDTELTDDQYNEDAVRDQKFNDMYIRFVPEVEHGNWAKFIDFAGSDNFFAIKANRKLDNILVQREKSKLEYKHSYAFKKKPGDPNYSLISADSISLAIEDKTTPYFRFGVNINLDSENPDPENGPRVTKFKDSEIIISCTVLGEFRNFASPNATFINEFGEGLEEGTLIDNLEQSGGFLPFSIVEKKRYKWKHIRGGMKDGVVSEGGEIIEEENEEEDEEKMIEYTNDQYDRMKRQEATGDITFIGTDTGYKIGDRIDNLIVRSNSIPMDVVILDLNASIETGTTIISIGKA